MVGLLCDGLDHGIAAVFSCHFPLRRKEQTTPFDREFKDQYGGAFSASQIGFVRVCHVISCGVLGIALQDDENFASRQTKARKLFPMMLPIIPHSF